MNLFELLKAVTVDCKDNGECFTVVDRLSAIERLLECSSYRIVAQTPLSLIYAKRDIKENESVVLISSHVDCVYERCFCQEKNGMLCGTFDNSFGNAAVLFNMLNGTLPDNVAVAFTGNEERDSKGAQQVLQALGERVCKISFAIVLDITNVGWGSNAVFAIENDSCIDILTSYGIVSSLEIYSGRFAFCHNAEPDESWLYSEYGIPCLSLCLPAGGNLHGDEGVLICKESAVEFCHVLSLLAGFLSSHV